MSGADDAPRLKARLRVQAIIRQAAVNGRAAAVVRRGDVEAGAVLVLLRTPGNDLVALSETRAPDGGAAFLRATGPDGPVPPDVAQAYVERAVARDPDVWVVEIDTGPDAAPPFPARIL